MRPLVKLSAIAALSVLPIASVMASETSRASSMSLAEAAESFAEEVLGLPSGSARAQSIDRRILLGDCTSGWAWGFAFGSRQSVQVVCPGDPRSRRLVALSFAEASEPKEVTGREPAAMIVATRHLPFGHRLTSGDIREQPLGAGVRPSVTLSSPEQVVGQTLTRAVRQGDPLGRADLRAAVVIKRNSIIMGWSDFSGGRVSAKLLALENGKIGEWIDLENPQSGRRLRGEVQTDGSVRLGSPGASTSTMASDAAKVSLARVD